MALPSSVWLSVWQHATRETMDLPQCHWSRPLYFVAIKSVMGLHLVLAVTINCPAQQTPGHGLPSLPNRLSVVGLWRLYTFPAGIHVTQSHVHVWHMAGFVTACALSTVWDGNVDKVAQYYESGLLPVSYPGPCAMRAPGIVYGHSLSLN